jgi:hypothetical protein
VTILVGLVLQLVAGGLPAPTVLAPAAPLAALRGAVGVAARGGGGPRGGMVLGVDGGWAGLVGATGPLPEGFAFGIRCGYQLPNGLEVMLRYDDLGVDSPPPHRSSSSPLLETGAFGFRYAVPFLVPLPFVEAAFGPAFYDGSVEPSGSVGGGLSVPLGRHVLVDLSVRDRLVPIHDELRQIITLELGVAVSFASPGG